MKYMLLESDKEKYWYELDDEGYAHRQIVSDEQGKIHISCLEDCLAEGPVNEEDLDGSIINLSKSEFDILWQNTLKPYKKLWKEIKNKYPIGACVQGKYSYSYPQGSIIKGDDFIAIYKGDEPFNFNQLTVHKVKLYDDINMWLVVE